MTQIGTSSRTYGQEQQSWVERCRSTCRERQTQIEVRNKRRQARAKSIGRQGQQTWISREGQRHDDCECDVWLTKLDGFDAVLRSVQTQAYGVCPARTVGQFLRLIVDDRRKDSPSQPMRLQHRCEGSGVHLTETHPLTIIMVFISSVECCISDQAEHQKGVC